MAVGIFGGTFDPIHVGHIITTRAVLEERNLEKVIFIPSYISPLKQNIISESDQHRIKMVKIAIDDMPYFEVNDLELRRGNVSYTLDTLIELKKYYSNLELIIGYDNLLVFEKWHKPDEIFELAKVIVMKRNIDNVKDHKNRFFDKVIFVDTPTIEISATGIRERIKNNLPVDYLVPQCVNEYINNNHLYISF